MHTLHHEVTKTTITSYDAQKCMLDNNDRETRELAMPHLSTNNETGPEALTLAQLATEIKDVRKNSGIVCVPS